MAEDTAQETDLSQEPDLVEEWNDEPVGESPVPPESNKTSGLTQRQINVDPQTAYESGLCKTCKPTQPSPWNMGVLLKIQVAFSLLVFLILFLLILAILLITSYLNTYGKPRPMNRRSSSSFSSS